MVIAACWLAPLAVYVYTVIAWHCAAVNMVIVVCSIAPCDWCIRSGLGDVKKLSKAYTCRDLTISSSPPHEHPIWLFYTWHHLRKASKLPVRSYLLYMYRSNPAYYIVNICIVFCWYDYMAVCLEIAWRMALRPSRVAHIAIIVSHPSPITHQRRYRRGGIHG